MTTQPPAEIRDVLGIYGLDAVEIISVDEHVFRVRADQGVFCLKLVKVSGPQLEFICAAMDNLSRRQFHAFSELVRTPEGDAFVTRGRERYLLTKWIEGIKCDFGRWEHLKAAAQTLARFHLASHSLEKDTPGQEMWESWPEVYKGRTASLANAKAAVRQKVRRTEFDEMFLQHVDAYYAQALQALDTLNRSSYAHLAAEARSRRFMVHRDIAPRNFVITPEQQGCLIDFDYARFDLRCVDVTRLLGWALKKSSWDPAKAAAVLEVYNQANPIQPEEYPVMLAFMQFPLKFWQLANRYYGNHKEWPEAKFIRKLNKLLGQRRQRELFLKQFTASCP